MSMKTTRDTAGTFLRIVFCIIVVIFVNWFCLKKKQDDVLEATGCKVGLRELIAWGRWQNARKVAELIKKGCP